MYVLLKDKTLGYTSKACKIGDFVTVSFRDENGHTVAKSGRVVDIIDDILEIDE